MNLFKRNKENDLDFSSSFWNGKQRLGYDAVTCYTEKEINAAKKDGFVQTMAELEEVNSHAKDSKKRSVKASLKSNGGGDGGDDSPEQRVQLCL
jgi:hypothetical protein